MAKGAPPESAGSPRGRVSLSICIPTYNRRMFLKEALDSIIPQVVEGVEIVVSFNDAGDGTREMLAEYAERHPFISSFDEGRNQGADRAFLNAAARGRGGYIWIFSDDDVMREGAVGRMMDEIAAHPDIDVFHQGHVFLGSGRKHKIGWKTFGFYDHDAVYDSAEGFLNEERMAYSGYLSAIVMRKSEWDAYAGQAEGFVGTSYVHMFILLSVLRAGGRIKCISPAYVLNRPDNDSFKDKSLSLEKMLVKRKAIDITGYDRLSAAVFGKGSKLNRRANMSVMKLFVLPEIVIAKANNVGAAYFDELRKLAHEHYSSYPFYWLVLCPLLLIPGFIAALAVRAARLLRR